MTITGTCIPLALASVLALAAGCSSSVGTKAGSAAGHPMTLRIAVPDTNDAGSAYFIQSVRKRTQGRLKLVVDDGYTTRYTTKEARLVPDLSDGTAKIGYVPSRDWSLSGLPEFQALAAPFAVTSQAGMESVAHSDFADKALERLKSKHVIGLGLVPVEPRQLLTTRPIATADDLRGAAIRVSLNPILSAGLASLGATTADVVDSQKVTDVLASGRVTGVETSPEYLLANGYVDAAPYLTSWAISAKFQVIAINERTWDRLDHETQAALRAAARDTVARAGQRRGKESQELEAMCGRRAVVVRPTQEALDELVRGATVDTSAFADAATALAKVPQTGPTRESVQVPSSCARADDTTSAVALYKKSEASPADSTPSSAAASFPEGTYTTTTTVADLRKGGQYGADWQKPITWTFRFENGKVRETQDPDYPDQGPCDGRYTTSGDTLSITWTTNCPGTEVTRWSYFQGQLTLKNLDVTDTAGRVIYEAHPWRKTD